MVKTVCSNWEFSIMEVLGDLKCAAVIWHKDLEDSIRCICPASVPNL